MKTKIDGVSWSVQAQQIVNEIHLHAESGEFIGLIGPNGSGKSSLLRLIYRIYPPSMGVIFINERNIWEMSTKEVARYAAVVAQERGSDFDFTVNEIVMMGRTSHKGLFDSDSKEDDMIVQDSLVRVGLPSFANRYFHTLSGGEKQRVLVARALAQQAHVLILDEPTNHLDIRYQLEILDLVRSLGVTTIIVLHDLNLAATYCDRLYLLQAGRIVTHGQPKDVLTSEYIKTVYAVHAEVNIHSVTGKLHIVFTGITSQAGMKTAL